MRALVCGGRSYADASRVFAVLDLVHELHCITCVIHGACGHPGPLKGADRFADAWALSRGILPLRFPALWAVHGRAAGPLRNGLMLQASPDVVIAFPGGGGTSNMCSQARRAGVTVWMYE